ncbi:MAG: HlyD family efflux transporter periplasmic adaptor subunit [Candidatus Liptonbacteria bacterium]|nr:HlyD family efflux transporter periplasmic adaptor subunit [Candidatus Liptonbacteria bacterium]
MKSGVRGGIRAWVFAHKLVAVGAAAVVVGGGYYLTGWFGRGSEATRYVLAGVTRGTVVASVSGAGQVSALNQVEVKPKASGEVLSLPVREGQSVRAGGVLAQLDSNTAQKSVRDAEANVKSAQISLEKLRQPPDELSLTQAENAVTDANFSKQNAQNDLEKGYEDGFTLAADAFVDLPGVMLGLDGIVNGTTLNGSQNNADAYYDLIKLQKPSGDQFRDLATAAYQSARAAYDKNLDAYKNASRFSATSTIETLVGGTYASAKSISEAIRNTKNFLDLVNDVLTSKPGTRIPSLLAAHESNLQSYIGTVNSHISSLLAALTAIQNGKDGVANAARTITERMQALAKLKAGADPLDVASQQLSLTQRENALRDARETLADYSVRAPFDGIVAKLNAKKGDEASQGTAIATLITSQQTVAISLNEVDVGKVRLGAKATLTFDAIPDLTATGSVVQIDAIGTVTQGVVNYGVTIALDTQDGRVKPGMSVSAMVVTDMRQDVLTVPNAALKAQGNMHYVQVARGVEAGVAGQSSAQGMLLALPPQRQAVTIGLSNDAVTELTSGVKEGDVVVTREITPSAQTQTAQQAGGNAFRLPGAGGGGGVIFRR